MISSVSRRRLMTFLSCWLLMVLAAGGCSTPAGQIFTALDQPIFWPAGSEAPRIQYIGQIQSPADLKPARSGWENFWGVIVGREVQPPMISPLNVVLVGEHRLYVTDPGAGCLHLFDLESRAYRRIGSEAGIREPIGVATDGNRLFVTDAAQNAVLLLDLDGNLKGKIGAGQLVRPAGICVVPADHSILVADAQAHQIVRFSPEGGLVGRIGSRGSRPGQFNYPSFLACDQKGQIYVSDSMNFRVQILDLSGHSLGMIGSIGNRPGNLSLPKGVGVDGEGHIYVVDARFENVQVFSRSGQVLLPFGQEGKDPGKFWLPAGLYIDPHNRIWICDSYNQRVQLFQYLNQMEVTGERPASASQPR